MATADIITFEVIDSSNTFSLTEEHYDIIISNVLLARCIVPCFSRFGIIKECFKDGGPWGNDGAFEDDFWTYYGEYRRKTLNSTVHRDLVPSVESLPQITTLLESGCKVLDIGCGQGLITCELAKKYQSTHFTGFDISGEALIAARGRQDEAHLENLDFVKGQGIDLPTELGSLYDIVIAVQFLHNLPDPIRMVSDIEEVLKPNGYFLLIDARIRSNLKDNIGNMAAAYSLSVSQFYCLPFSLSGDCRVGYGMGWGEENMLKVVEKKFKLIKRFDFPIQETLYCFEKLRLNGVVVNATDS